MTNLKGLGIIIIIVVLATSCESKKRVVTSVERSETETVQSTIDETTRLESLGASVVDTTKIKEVIIRKTETEYETFIDSVSGNTTSVPVRTTTTETIVKETSKGVSDTLSTSSKVTEKKEQTNIETDVQETVDQDVKYFKRKSILTKIYRILLTIGAILLFGYIVLKKYFPRIFVKLLKLIRLL